MSHAFSFALRKVLGGEWLVTVPGRGYRFVAPLAPAGPTEPTGPAAAAVAEAPASPRTNLPTLQPLLIGRSDDLAALGTLIDQHRLVTVVGAGGTDTCRRSMSCVRALRGQLPQLAAPHRQRSRLQLCT